VRKLLGASMAVLLAAGCAPATRAGALTGNPAPAVSASTSPSSPPSELPSAAPSAPAGLRVIDYGPAPKGFPADPDAMSTTLLTEGVHPTTKIAVYDAVGGKARAYLMPTISGVELTMPVVDRKPGWVAVLLPSVNRTIGWLPDGGWKSVALTDQLVLHRKTHRFEWYRNGALRDAWTVTIGSSATPTPLGRTFVLGRGRLEGAVYAGIDVLALGSVPDRPDAVATGLRGAHIGIHSWYRDEFGRNVSNGCIRVPQPGQRRLVDEVRPGTEVIVLD
jgi:hypothetical protein